MNYQLTWMLSSPTLIEPVTLNFNKFLPWQHSQALTFNVSVLTLESTAL